MINSTGFHSVHWCQYHISVLFASSRLRRVVESGLLYHERTRWHSPKPMCVRQIQPEDLEVKSLFIVLNCDCVHSAWTCMWQMAVNWESSTYTFFLQFHSTKGTFAVGDVSIDAIVGWYVLQLNLIAAREYRLAHVEKNECESQWIWS